VTAPIRILLAVAVAASALLLTATAASAGRSQVTILQDDSLLLGAAERRDATLDEWRALGVDVVKIRVNWRDMSPRERPADPSDPNAYSADHWARYDRAIRGAKERGMEVFLMLGGHAPPWASKKSPRGLSAGVHRPNASLFGQFVRAVGTRYAGNYAEYGGGPPLPRVTIWSIWNEPNLVSWLSPQRQAPRLYRNLLYAGFDGLNATGHGGDTILYGELLPFARGNRTAGVRRRPIEFLRELACVDRRYRAYRGSKARARGCQRFRRLPGVGVAHHPYTLAGGPRIGSPNRDDVSISELGRLTRALDRLTRKRRFATSRRQLIWSTEFGFQTDPPDPFQSRIKKVPGYMGEAEFMAYRNPRVVAWSQYPFNDDEIPNRGANRFGGFQSGLKFENGRRKPGVYDAFRFPFHVRRLSRSRVQLFGAVRPAGPGATVAIESRIGKRKWRRLGTLRTGPQGYFLRTFRAAGGSKRQFVFRVEGGRSRVARAAGR
jgi:hypothetical protein